MSSFDIARKQSNSYGSYQPKKKRRKLRWLLFLLIVAGLAFGAGEILSRANQIFTNKQNVFVRTGSFLFGKDKPLIGEDKGMVNVLLLGIGGPGHEGPYLTDTMIVAQIDPVSHEVVLTSIPRDFLVQIPKVGYTKVNAAYAYAHKNNPDTAGDAAIAAAEKITGLKIPYYATVDFKGFVKAIDHVGGVDVIIDRTFTDSSYPDYRYGYLPSVTFTKGPEHMDGERALVFARSRKGSNNEGSDFARSERQKKIMVAFKEKAIRLNITDLRTMNNLLSDFTENLRTNLEPHEIKRLAEITKDTKSEDVYSFSLEPQGDLICNGFVEESTGRPAPTVPTTPAPPAATDQPETTIEPEPQVTRIYVVQPCEGKTLSDIHDYVAKAGLISRLKNENADIEIQNSTGKSYALDNWRLLSNLGLNIKITAFKGKVPYDRTILYDNSAGLKPKTLDYLKSEYNFSTSDVPLTGTTSDFVIILGRDSL